MQAISNKVPVIFPLNIINTYREQERPPPEEELRGSAWATGEAMGIEKGNVGAGDRATRIQEGDMGIEKRAFIITLELFSY